MAFLFHRRAFSFQSISSILSMLFMSSRPVPSQACNLLMPNDLLMFIFINLIKSNVNIEENALVHSNSRPWLISIDTKYLQ